MLQAVQRGHETVVTASSLHRTVRVGRDLTDHLGPTPLP